MDLKQLLGKLDLLEGSMNKAAKNPTGPKFTGQWKGTDKGLPGRKLVGDSIEPEENILKDLSKGPSPKTKEQELAEQFEQFLQQLEEENLGVEEKRPSRKGSRPARDYGKDGEPSKRYTKVEEAGDRAGALNTATQLKRAIENSQNKPAHEIEYLTKQMNALMRKYNIKPEELQTPTGHQQQSRQQTPPPPPPPKGPGVDWAKHQADFEKAHQTYQADFEKAYQASQAELNKAFQASMPPGMMPKTKMAEASAEELNVGDDVIITGPVEHQGETGVIDSFGQDNRFVVVNLYNHGKKSFHSSDVSYNDYAGSDEEEAEMYDRDPEFRDWAARQDVAEGIEDDELSSQELRDRIKTAISAHDEETADWGNPGFARHFGKTSLQSALNRKYGILKALKDKSLPLAQRLKFKDLLANVEREIEDLQMAESQGDPHKILLNKLRDIERKPSAPNADDDAKRAKQAKADYKKYVEKMKKKNPNFIPLYKIDEYGADQPAGTAGQTSLGTAQPNQAQQAQKAKEVAQATQTLKAATGATVPTTSLAKAIDAASQGTAVDAQSMKALEPIMKDVAAVASDPKLASQFKSLASQINQTQAKQAQQKT